MPEDAGKPKVGDTARILGVILGVRINGEKKNVNK